MSESIHYILGTAGHIDHGKSSLVKALTGTDPDRLPEEKLRGVTIELGFAHLTLDAPGREGDCYELGIVDVPGHADFINNMVAGVGGMDIALLVVAADDGWMPQTEEHLHILSYLGIERTLIALTKADLVEDIDFAAEFVRECIRGTTIEHAPLVPVSSITGLGLAALRAELGNLLAETPPPNNFGKPLLPVDRAFSVKGMGTVVTGTLSGGSLEVGDSLQLHPGGLSARVRAIQNHNAAISTASPGMRAALNVPELNIASRHRPGVHRGTLLASPGTGEPSGTINLELTRLGREIPGQGATRRVLPAGRRVRVHHGSGSVGARIYYLDGRSLAPGETRIAQLRLDSPRLVLVGDRIVIRDWSGQGTLAGGLVLETAAARRGFRSDSQRAFLQSRAADPTSREVLLCSALERDHLLTTATLGVHLRVSPAELDAALSRLVKAGHCQVLGNFHADTSWWNDELAAAAARVTAYHKRHPDLPGLAVQDFRNDLPSRLAADPVFHHLLAALAARGIIQSNTVLADKRFSPSLADDISKPAAAIEAALSRAPLNPPGRAELAGDDTHRRALSFLVRSKRVVALGDKAVILSSALDSAEQAVLAYLDQHGKATASELRQVLGTSRRILMPLLEGMDAKLLTRRDGDYRVRV